MQARAWLRPSRTVPITTWRSASRWTSRPRTLAILVTGLLLFGTGDGLLVVAGHGVSPWTVLAEGLSLRLPITIGVATFVVSSLVLLLWIPLRQRPGLGTIANIILIAAALEATVRVVPQPHGWFSFALVLVAIALIGLGSGLYLTCNLGPGPRDGWMTGIHHRTGWPVAQVRLAIEVVVLAIGWLLGGTVGLGTVAFALLIGPAVGFGLMLAGWIGRSPGQPTAEVDEEEFPELDA